MRQNRDWKEIYKGLKDGNRVQLGIAFSLIESKKQADRDAAALLINECTRTSRQDTLRIGITGSPGVGKSSVIEKLGLAAIAEGRKVAVLAIDPSSSISGGSILGDKTRMQELSANQRAFIRPSAAGKTLGGVAKTTREFIAICEAATYDLILVETVGVGQSETAVYDMTDMFLFLVLPGAGDELQGIKRGIVEMADLLVVNKSEKDRKKLASQTALDYRNALHLLRVKDSGWKPAVKTHSIYDSESTSALWKNIKEYEDHINSNNYRLELRRSQQIKWFDELLQNELLEKLFSTFKNKPSDLEELRSRVSKMELSPIMAVRKIMDRLEINLKHQ